MTADRRRVCIIGAGPGGLVLAHLLRRASISAVLLERLSARDLHARTKAGLIEHRTLELLRHHGLADPILERGTQNGVCEFRADGTSLLLDYGSLTGGRGHYIYPQHRLVGDLADTFLAAGGDIRFGVRATGVEQDDDGALVACRLEETGETTSVRCSVVARCDGAGAIIASGSPGYTTYAHDHPFRWLAVIAAAAPSVPRTVYAMHPRGFAGQMRRGPALTRYYLEIPGTDAIADWPDERIWAELAERLRLDGKPPPVPAALLERDMLDLRVRVVEPMQFGRVFLVGDAAHLITPAGGKGMNLAIQDAIELAQGLTERYQSSSGNRLERYSLTRLPAVWRTQEFSNWMLSLLHARVGSSTTSVEFAYRLRRARLDRLTDDPDFARWFAHAYAGADPVGPSGP
jgi:p-hydroxybenzoate 3-monooxygenase